MAEMTWPLWVVVAYLGLAALMHVGRTGKPRRVVTPSFAVAALIEYSAVIALVVYGALMR